MKRGREVGAVPTAITAILVVTAVGLMWLSPWGIQLSETLKQGMDFPFDVVPLVWAFPLKGE